MNTPSRFLGPSVILLQPIGGRFHASDPVFLPTLQCLVIKGVYHHVVLEYWFGLNFLGPCFLCCHLLCYLSISSLWIPCVHRFR